MLNREIAVKFALSVRLNACEFRMLERGHVNHHAFAVVLDWGTRASYGVFRRRGHVLWVRRISMNAWEDALGPVEVVFMKDISQLP